MYRKILFPTDGSEPSNAALKEAFRFARHFTTSTGIRTRASTLAV